MCALGDSGHPCTTAVLSAASESGISPAIVDRLLQPLEALSAAVKTRRIEPICAAYQSLRTIAPDMDAGDLFVLVDAAADRPMRNLVIEAFSHRHCFMCEGGSTACGPCRATGRLEGGSVCPNCDGAGLIECRFCGGTGWDDDRTVPSELAAAVAGRKIHRTQRAAAKLREYLDAATPAALANLPTLQRRKLVHELIRIGARLRELSGADHAEPRCQGVPFTTVAETLAEALDAIRVQ